MIFRQDVYVGLDWRITLWKKPRVLALLRQYFLPTFIALISECRASRPIRRVQTNPFKYLRYITIYITNDIKIVLNDMYCTNRIHSNACLYSKELTINK